MTEDEMLDMSDYESTAAFIIAVLLGRHFTLTRLIDGPSVSVDDWWVGLAEGSNGLICSCKFAPMSDVAAVVGTPPPSSTIGLPSQT